MKKLKEGSEKEALYKIEFKKSAVKELEKLNPRDIPRIVDAIESLSTNPFPHYSKKYREREIFIA